MWCHSSLSHTVGGFISQLRIGLGSVDSSSDSESSDESQEFASCICFHLHIGKFSMMSLLSAVWHGVAGVASGGRCLTRLVCLMLYSTYHHSW